MPDVSGDEVHRVEAPKNWFAPDCLLAAMFALLGFLLVIGTYDGFGMSWDEGYYYGPAKSTLEWVRFLFDSEADATSRQAIDAAFDGRENVAELPMVPKLVFAAGLWLDEKIDFRASYIAMRVPVAPFKKPLCREPFVNPQDRVLVDCQLPGEFPHAGQSVAGSKAPTGTLRPDLVHDLPGDRQSGGCFNTKEHR